MRVKKTRQAGAAKTGARPALRGALAGLLALGGGALLAPGEAAAQSVCGLDGGGTGGATATGFGSFACGPDARAVGIDSVAIGPAAGGGADPLNIRNTAIGALAGSDVTGDGNVATGVQAGEFVTGDSNTATGTFAGSFVTGDSNIAIGANAGRGESGTPLEVSRTVAIGPGAMARTDNAVALGTAAESRGRSSIAIGQDAFADSGTDLGSAAIAIGRRAQALSSGTIALGPESSAASSSLALGGFSRAGTDATPGAPGTFENFANLAVGYGSRAGAGAAGQVNSVAVGFIATANASRAAALGSGAKADHDDSVAIGANVATTRAGQVAIGTGASTYTLAGIASDASRAAQAGDTYLVTTDGAGNLAATPFSLGSDIASLGGEIAATRKEARQGVAAAIAMASAPMPSAPGKTTWATNLGHFRGENAFGGSLTHRFATANPFALTLGYSWGGGRNHAARVGLMGEF